MRLLRYVAATWLLALQIVAVPVHNTHKELKFVGPATRIERLEEGWIDEEAKYFHEPGYDDSLGHYDARFFRGVVTYEERTETLHHMIRSYLDFFSTHELETWIAHGTLLGWWWNGRILPWDWDIDTQVSGKTLMHLAKSFNQSTHRYAVAGSQQHRQYLLDVNPMSYERVRGDGMNIIDARWIDMSNGLFIDITGLSEIEPLTRPGVVSCKNLHHYSLRDLYPMRETTFEGVLTKIPYAYDKLLVEEYQQKALALTNYEGHHWDAVKKLWIKRPTIKPLYLKEPLKPLRERQGSQT